MKRWSTPGEAFAYETGYIEGRADIVRCKYCKHNPHNTTDDVCPVVDSDGYVKEFPNDDFFCKYGEGIEDVRKPD